MSKKSWRILIVVSILLILLPQLMSLGVSQVQKARAQAIVTPDTEPKELVPYMKIALYTALAADIVSFIGLVLLVVSVIKYRRMAKDMPPMVANNGKAETN